MEQNNSKIHVLHVVGRMDRGGTETLLMNLLRTIDRNQYQFDFVEQTNDICHYDEEILGLGSVIYRCPHISLTSLKSYRKWWHDFYLQHPEYKIIHGHSRGSAPIYLDEANKANRITILHCHSNSYGIGVKGLIRNIWQLPLHHLANYNFACSKEAGISQFGKNGDFTVINNGIETKRFIYDPEVRNKVRDDFHIQDQLVIGNVSRFETPKNHLFLIDIFNEILKLHPNSVLLLVGQGSLENKIREKIDGYGIQDKVIFTGLRSDVNELLQAMDVFVFPSLYEGLPVALIEAQASGLLSFVSDTVFPEGVNFTDYLYHIPLKDSPENWAKTILEKHNGYTRKDSSQTLIEKGFDIQSTVDWLCDFYKKVLYDH